MRLTTLLLWVATVAAGAVCARAMQPGRTVRASLPSEYQSDDHEGQAQLAQGSGDPADGVKTDLPGSAPQETGTSEPPSLLPPVVMTPAEVMELSVGRGRRGVLSSWLWSDDALEMPRPPADSPEAGTQASVVERQMRARIRSKLHDWTAAKRRILTAERSVGGSPFRDVSFQAVGWASLGGPFVIYGGRDVALPAGPRASLTWFVRSAGTGLAELDSDVFQAACDHLASWEHEQNKRRRDIVQRGVDLLAEGACERLRARALVFSAGKVGWLPEDDDQLKEITREWRQTEEEYYFRIKGLFE